MFMLFTDRELLLRITIVLLDDGGSFLAKNGYDLLKLFLLRKKRLR